MDDSERYMSIYQHQNWLRLIDWDQWNDERESTEKSMPKLIGDISKIDLHVKDVNDFFDQYLKEQITAKDYRLLKGTFWDEELRNEELQAISGDIYQIDESEISGAHFAQIVPYASTKQWNESISNEQRFYSEEIDKQ